MLSLEIKAIIYALVAGATFWFGWHCNGIVQDDKAKTLALAQAQIVQVQEEKNSATAAMQQQVSQQVQDNVNQQLQAANSTNANLSGLVRRYEALLSAGTVPSIPPAPGSAASASAVSSGSTGVDTGIANSIAACSADSARLQGWQDWYRAVSK